MIFSVEFGFENIMVVRTNQTHEERRLLPPWPMAIKNNITKMLGLKLLRYRIRVRKRMLL